MTILISIVICSLSQYYLLFPSLTNNVGKFLSASVAANITLYLVRQLHEVATILVIDE